MENIQTSDFHMKDGVQKPHPDAVLQPEESQATSAPCPLLLGPPLLLEKLPIAAHHIVDARADFEAVLQIGVIVTDDLQASVKVCQGLD